jgi:hypothetical protein
MTTALIILAAVIYMTPAIFAIATGHRQTSLIFLLNALLGWTFVGWVAALMWSSTANVTLVAAYQDEHA